jgi:hypothetical protein
MLKALCGEKKRIKESRRDKKGRNKIRVEDMREVKSKTEVNMRNTLKD